MSMLRNEGVNVDQIGDLFPHVLGHSGDNHPGIAVADERNAGQLLAPHKRDDILNVSVQSHCFGEVAAVVLQAGQRCNNHLSSCRLQSRCDKVPGRSSLKCAVNQYDWRCHRYTWAAASCEVMKSRTAVIWNGTSRLLVVVSIGSPAAYCNIKPANDCSSGSVAVSS